MRKIPYILYYAMIVLCVVLLVLSFPQIYQSFQYQSFSRVYYEDKINKEVVRAFRENIIGKLKFLMYEEQYKELPQSELARYALDWTIDTITFSEFSIMDANFDINNIDHQKKIHPVPKRILYISISENENLYLERIIDNGKKEDVWFKAYNFNENDHVFPPKGNYKEMTLQEIYSKQLAYEQIPILLQDGMTSVFIRFKYIENIGRVVSGIRLRYSLTIREKSMTLSRLGLYEIITLPIIIKNSYQDGYLEKMNMLLYDKASNIPVYLQKDDETIPEGMNLETLPTQKLIFFEKDGEEHFLMMILYDKDLFGPNVYKIIWGKKSLLMADSESVMTEKEYHLILLSIIILLVMGAGIRFYLTRRMHKQLSAILQDQDYENIAIVPSRKNICETLVLLSEKSKSIAQHLPDKISSYLIDHKNDYPVYKTRIGCLVIDLKGFSLYSENRSNFNLTRVVNAFYAICIQVVRAHNGRIDKFIGDSVVALWTHQEEQQISKQMVLSAVKISQLFSENEVFHNTGMSLRIGIDIHDGEMGIFGSKSRLCYTAAGYPIDFATELEGMNNVYQSEVLLSERVNIACEQVTDDYIIRWIDRIEFKSHQEKIYELIPLHSPVYPLVKDNDYIQRYEKALNAYCSGKVSKAYKLFCEIQSDYPSDYLAHVFISRCKNYKDYQTTPVTIWRMFLYRVVKTIRTIRLFQ